MKTLDQIAREATQSKVCLRLNVDGLGRAAETSVDGLFYTPLLALTILVVAGARRSGLPTSDIATWALGTLVKHFEGLRFARGRIQWSLVLRRRCADAAVFLEDIRLATVHDGPTRRILATSEGRNFIRKLARGADEIGVLVRQLERAHRAVEQGGLELL